MTNTYVDSDGVENVAVGIIKQAKKDFIKGVKVLYPIFKFIPTQKDLLQDPDHKTMVNIENVRLMYDAWRFVRDDPYQFFGDVGEESVIKAWTKEAVMEYYRSLYLKGGVLLYKTRAHKYIHKLTADAIISIINDFKISDGFINARNYVLEQPDSDKIFKEWNIEAFSRNRVNKGMGRGSIANTNYHKEAMLKRQENIRVAKEMYEAGESVESIAEELEVKEATVMGYLRS